MPERDIVFEIKEHLGTISKYQTGWTKELNLISWNGQPPKFDIRDWDPDHERMSRGITLHPREIAKIVELYLKKKNKHVIEDAQTAEEERWKRINAEKKQVIENAHEESEVFDDTTAENLAEGNLISEDVSAREEMAGDEMHFDTSALVEEQVVVNDSTPF